MYKSMKAHVVIIVLLTSSFINSSKKPWAQRIISEYSLECCLAAATTIFCTTLLYQYYQSTFNYEYIIEDCRKSYKIIAQDIQRYQSLYYADAQISNWDLKALILDNYPKPYPFMNYYKLLIKRLYRLHNHLAILNKKLKKIHIYKHALYKNKYSEKTAHFKEMFLQLELKGKNLHIQTIDTITLIIILKNRLKLFKEYNHDCLNWSQITQKNNTL